MPTVRELLRGDPSFAAYEGPFFVRILDIRLDGTPIGDLNPMTFGLAHCTPLDRDEIISVANVLTAVGYSDANMAKARPGDAPDFVVESSRGVKLYVEHTRAVSECVDDSTRQFLYNAMELKREESFTRAIEGLIVLVTVDHSATFVGPIQALTDPCPGDHITRNEARSAIDELRGLALSGYFRSLCGQSRGLIPATQAPVLGRFRPEVHVGPQLKGKQEVFQVSSTRFVPRKMSLWELCDNALRKKTLPPPGYVGAKSPLAALVIQVKAGTHELQYDLLDYKAPDITPFKHVGIALWHNWTLVVAGWSRAEDGEIETYAPTLPAIPDPTDHQLREWVERVEDFLRDRWYSETRDTTDRIPKIITSPVSVQWYRSWFGPGPWVTCKRTDDAVAAHFWRVEESYANGVSKMLRITEPEESADLIWSFIVEGESAALS